MGRLKVTRFRHLGRRNVSSQRAPQAAATRYVDQRLPRHICMLIGRAVQTPEAEHSWDRVNSDQRIAI